MENQSENSLFEFKPYADIKLTSDEMEQLTMRCNHISEDLFCKNNLGFTLPVECRNDITDTCSLYCNGIVYNSSYMSRFNDDEIAFVFAHEIGHKLCESSLCTDLLEDVLTKTNDMFNEMTNSNKEVDQSVLLGVRKDSEFEADRIGKYLSEQAGYFGAETALEKMDNGATEFFNIIGDHPFTSERLHALALNPIVQFDAKEIRKESILLHDLCVKIKDNTLTDDDKMMLFTIEKKYTDIAYHHLNNVQKFISSRKEDYKKALDKMDISDNSKMIFMFHKLYNFYDKYYYNKNKTSVAVVYKDTEIKLMNEMKDFRDLAFSNTKKSFKNTLKKFICKAMHKGDENEIS